MAESLRLVTKFRKYNVLDRATIRDFYSLLGWPSWEPKRWVTFQCPEQTFPSIKSKMQVAD
jgi:hypothetical protein